MIPRLKPYLDHQEILVLFRDRSDAVSRFEAEFARALGTRFAIAFPYGRSALWAFFKALNVQAAEIIQPAYTCSVVAHATVLSENTPRFVDLQFSDYNMDLQRLAEAINERTGAVIATHLFGYPMDVLQLQEIVQAAEARYGKKIWVIQDCAHSFGARWRGVPVSSAGDVALFGLNISKVMTSIFGGMLTTDNADLAGQIRHWRDQHFIDASMWKALRRRLYLLATYPAFHEVIYGLTYWLQEKTPVLNRLTKAYHLDGKIHFPPDYLDRMLAVEAEVGMVQLKKYPEIIRQRISHACYFDQQLQNTPGLDLPPVVDGATYSHYVLRVEDRQKVLEGMAAQGIQVGTMIDYSVPHMPAYQRYLSSPGDFPNSLYCSQHTVNLPLMFGDTGYTHTTNQKITSSLQSVMRNL